MLWSDEQATLYGALNFAAVPVPSAKPLDPEPASATTELRAVVGALVGCGVGSGVGRKVGCGTGRFVGFGTGSCVGTGIGSDVGLGAGSLVGAG